MKISVLQMNIVWADPAANAAKAAALLDAAEPADLYVLPEMWSTGFATQPRGIAENDCRSLEWMKAQAAKRNAAVAGSVATEEEGKYFNRFYFVKPDGTVSHYDKHHLFTYGGEHHRFTAGTKRTIVEWQGVRFLLEVCYDLRFPCWSRCRGDYDVALYVASWPAVRIDAWNTLLRARAIENQCYVVGVNRVGNDPSLYYNGCSTVVDPYGRSVVDCEEGKECFATAQIDMEALQGFRSQFPVLDDADHIQISINKDDNE